MPTKDPFGHWALLIALAGLFLVFAADFFRFVYGRVRAALFEGADAPFSHQGDRNYKTAERPDNYPELRDLPFAAVASALDMEMARFAATQDGAAWLGPCPIHRTHNDSISFSYAHDGKWHCSSCNAVGRGAIDLAMKVKNLTFQGAVALLGDVRPGGMVDTAVDGSRTIATPTTPEKLLTNTSRRLS